MDGGRQAGQPAPEDGDVGDHGVAALPFQVSQRRLS
jgi:hypothetical protein